MRNKHDKHDKHDETITKVHAGKGVAYVMGAPMNVPAVVQVRTPVVEALEALGIA